MFGAASRVAGERLNRVAQQLLLFGALLGGRAGYCAADQPGVVSGAHGRVMMLYLSQPIGARGASRIYGLRLQQATAPPTLSNAAPSPMSHERDIVDLQVRHYSDIRVEFGQRVTWNVGRSECGPSGAQSSMAIRLPGPTLSTAAVARAQP
jgi:hypothetical protein